jgi:hypothetical protein
MVELAEAGALRAVCVLSALEVALGVDLRLHALTTVVGVTPIAGIAVTLGVVAAAGVAPTDDLGAAALIFAAVEHATRGGRRRGEGEE